MDIDKLVAMLKNASQLYYNSGTSDLTDDEYDALVNELKKNDPNNEFLKTIGAPVSGSFKTVKHAPT